MTQIIPCNVEMYAVSVRKMEKRQEGGFWLLDYIMMVEMLFPWSLIRFLGSVKQI